MKSIVTSLIAVVLAVGFMPASGHAQTPKSDVTLRVGSYGGIFDDFQKRFGFSVFTELTGIKIEVITGSPKTHLAKLIAAKGRDVPLDVVLMDEDIQADAITAGVISKIDPAKMSNYAYLYPSAKQSDGYGPGFTYALTGIAYNAEKFKAAGIPAPTSWKDLWDPKLAGRVAVPSIDVVFGRQFVIAAEHLAGGDESTPDKGVAEIKKIKAHSYFLTSIEVQSKFNSGEVWAAPWSNANAWRPTTSRDIHFVVPSEGAFDELGTLDMVAGTPHPAEAMALINFMLGPLPQMGNAYELMYSSVNSLIRPTLKSGPDAVTRDLANADPSKEKVMHVDWKKFWVAFPTLQQAWNRQIMNQ